MRLFVMTALFHCLQWRQMDIDYTIWQMRMLCRDPRVVYQHTAYHKQTKNQWARDDPAFVALSSIVIATVAVAYSIAFATSLREAMGAVFWAVLVDYIGLGIAISLASYVIVERALRPAAQAQPQGAHAVEQRLEPLYAFDVHCNAFVPAFAILGVGQFLLSPLLLRHGALATVVSCLLYAAGIISYSYTHFLGFKSLPFVHRSEVFMLPAAAALLALPVALLTGFNPARFTLGVHFPSHATV